MADKLMYRGLFQRLNALLRNNLTDPADRGSETTDNFTGDGSTTEFELTNKKLANVKEVKVDGTDCYEFVDYTKAYDNPKDTASKPKVVFDTAPDSDANITVKYHYDGTWIFPGFPVGKFTPPRISITQISSRMENIGIGRMLNETEKAMVPINWYQIDLWTRKGHSFTIGNEYYSGGKLLDYLADRVVEVIETNKEYLRDIGIDDIILRTARDLEYGEDLEIHRKLLDYELTSKYIF